jgi:hypothetical protein
VDTFGNGGLVYEKKPAKKYPTRSTRIFLHFDLIYPHQAQMSILDNLISELSSNGFDGLQRRIQQLAAMEDKPLEAVRPSDPSCVQLLSDMAVQINTAIEQNSPSIFEVGLYCFIKVLNFICQGIPDLFLVEQAEASDIAPIRAMYLQVFLSIPVSLWPNYLYIFGLAYPSVLSLWITWLREETRINREREKIHQTFELYLSSEWQGNGLAYERNQFLVFAMAQDLLSQLGLELHEINKMAPDVLGQRIYELVKFVKNLFNKAPKASPDHTIYLEINKEG